VSGVGRAAGWHRVEEARPLVAWRTAQRAEVARALEQGLRAWSQAWGLSEPPGVTCSPVTPQDLGRSWEPLGTARSGAAWLSLPPSLDAGLANLLWGCDTSAPIARRVTAACRADLPAQLCAALHLEASAGAAPEPSPRGCAWSGQLAAALGMGVFVLLDAGAIEDVLRSLAPGLRGRTAPAGGAAALTPLTRALAGRRLALTVRLSDCELELASLQDLRIGDIVPLPHRLDAALQVCDPQGHAVLAGYLARQGRRKALELTATREGAASPA
jgi:hypothetical protein